MNELEPQKENWDIKKIAALLLIVGVFIFGLKTFVLDKRLHLRAPSQVESTKVQGASTQENPNPIPESLNLQKNIEDKLGDLKKEVNNINVTEIASSSPQIKKVLNDLKNLENVPQNQAKDACLKICSSL